MSGLTDKIGRSARGPVRQIRHLAGRPCRVRARGQRRAGNLDQLPRHQDHADRRRWREKAEATARRIEQSVSELERQISWVTRASAVTPSRSTAPTTPSCSTRCRRSTSSPASTATAANSCGCRAPTYRWSAARPTFPATRAFTETVGQRRQLRAGLFQRLATASCRSRCRIPGFNAGVTVAEIDLRFLADFLGDAQVGKAAFAYVVDPRGQVLASSAKGPEVGKDPRDAAAGRRRLMRRRPASSSLGHRRRRPFGADRGERGAETRLVRVVRAADRAGAGADPRSAGADRCC